MDCTPPVEVDGCSTVQQTGDDANRIQIAFLGDGYTESQLADI